MASYNKVILIGNLTRDPELRYLPTGTAVSELGLAVSETFKNKAGETVETVCFVDIVVWARQAETCNQFLHKGSPIMVEGRLQLDKWTTKEGENRSKLRVRAERVQFLGAPRGAAPAGGEVVSPPVTTGATARSAGTGGPDAFDDGPPPHTDAGPQVDEDNLPF